MRELLVADLRSTMNLALHREGRRVLLGAGLSLGFLFLVADAFGRILTMHPGATFGLDAGLPPPPLPAVLGTALSPGLLLATWFGFSGGPRQLFELPQITLWLTAPMHAPAILLATWLRFGTLVAIWCAAVCGPVARRLAADAGGALAWWQIACAAVVLALPATAVGTRPAGRAGPLLQRSSHARLVRDRERTRFADLQRAAAAGGDRP